LTDVDRRELRIRFPKKVRLGAALQLGFLHLRMTGTTSAAMDNVPRALGWEEIKKFIEKAGEGIRATRERALLSVAYDLMARRGKLVALEVRDLTFYPDGTGRALIRRSKTDQTGEGSSAYLTRDTVR
jgi:integrase